MVNGLVLFSTFQLYLNAQSALYDMRHSPNHIQSYMYFFFMLKIPKAPGTIKL